MPDARQPSYTLYPLLFVALQLTTLACATGATRPRSDVGSSESVDFQVRLPLSLPAIVPPYESATLQNSEPRGTPSIAAKKASRRGLFGAWIEDSVEDQSSEPRSEKSSSGVSQLTPAALTASQAAEEDDLPPSVWHSGEGGKSGDGSDESDGSGGSNTAADGGPGGGDPEDKGGEHTVAICLMVKEQHGDIIEVCIMLWGMTLRHQNLHFGTGDLTAPCEGRLGIIITRYPRKLQSCPPRHFQVC